MQKLSKGDEQALFGSATYSLPMNKGDSKLLDLFRASFFTEMSQYDPNISSHETLTDDGCSIGIVCSVTVYSVRIETYLSIELEGDDLMVFVNENADKLPLSKDLFFELFLLQLALDVKDKH